METFETFIEKLTVKLLIVLLSIAGIGGEVAFVMCKSAHNGLLGLVALGVAAVLYYNYKKEFKQEEE